MTDYLKPSLRPEQMFPPKTAFMARTSLERTRLLGYRPVNQDAVTSLLSGLLSGMATVRHRAGATPAILEAYRRAGLDVREDQYCYDQGEEAEALAERLIGQGYRLAYPYPLAEGRFSEHGLLVPTALWERLNAKDNLADLVPDENLARRQVLSLAKAADFRPRAPVWLKAAGGQATGWGYAVRHSTDLPGYQLGLAELAALPDVSHVIIEEDIPVQHCWCASIGVTDTGVAFAGWAEQEFSGPGRQSGSVINPDVPFPTKGRELVENIGQRAAALGFRGLAGFDVGQSPEGRLVVFDPNFRFNSSTPLAMFYGAMAKRSGLPAARHFHATSTMPIEKVIALCTRATQEGWFLPTRLLDGALLPATEGQSYVTGLVMGHDLSDTAKRAADLTATLAS